MNVQSENAIAIKRDLKDLINHYSATYCNSPQYALTLAVCHHSLFNSVALPENLRSVGQLGLGSGLELLSLWFAKRLLSPQSRLLIKLYEPTATSCYALKAQWDQLGLLHHDHPLAPFAHAIIDAYPAAIIGCQRLIFDDGRFVIDLQFGDCTSALRQLPANGHHFIDTWFVEPQFPAETMTEKLLWQLAKLSADDACLIYCETSSSARLSTLADKVGLTSINLANLANPDTSIPQSPFGLPSHVLDPLLAQEREAMRSMQLQQHGFCPLPTPSKNKKARRPVAIIGGGIASAMLCLSLSERGINTTLFCKDNSLGQGASGNRQGALYPLLTPENSPLSQFFQQAFLFSRRRVRELSAKGHHIGHDFCGVLQTGHDERSTARLNKIIDGQDWPSEIAQHVNAEQANALAGVSIDKGGFYYPLGGWICPFEYADAAIAQAKTLSSVNVNLNCEIDELIPQDGMWYLRQQASLHGPFEQVVVANGAALTRFVQTSQLQASGFRGQVSHVPTRKKLGELKTVLCAHGYLTPAQDNLHCAGASYVKDAPDLDYCALEQLENLQKMQHSYLGQAWVDDIDIRGHDARVGVRMVTRDHFPMMGCAPNVDDIFAQYQLQQLTKESQHYWQTQPAPVHHGLYVLGALGSRGLSSGPLVAECLAAMLCGELPPMSYETLSLLNPNRMWLRKLVKGKSLI